MVRELEKIVLASDNLKKINTQFYPIRTETTKYDEAGLVVERTILSVNLLNNSQRVEHFYNPGITLPVRTETKKYDEFGLIVERTVKSSSIFEYLKR